MIDNVLNNSVEKKEQERVYGRISVKEKLAEKSKYSKKDTELVDTRLDGVRNLRNYCAHNSMVVGLTSSVVLRDHADDAATLPRNIC